MRVRQTIVFAVIGLSVALASVFVFYPVLAQTDNTTSVTGTNMTGTNMSSASNQTGDNATGQVSGRGGFPT